jgi:hypothetical protein
MTAATAYAAASAAARASERASRLDDVPRSRDPAAPEEGEMTARRKKPETVEWEVDREFWFGFYTPTPGEAAACFHAPRDGEPTYCTKPNAGGSKRHFLFRRALRGKKREK